MLCYIYFKISFYCRIICIFVSNEAISRSEKGNKSNLINVMCICCLPWKTFVNFPAHLIEIHLVPTDSRERREGQNFHNYFPSYCLLWPSARDNFSFQGKFCFIFTFSAVLLSNLLRGNLQEYRKSFQLWMLFEILFSIDEKNIFLTVLWSIMWSEYWVFQIWWTKENSSDGPVQDLEKKTHFYLLKVTSSITSKTDSSAMRLLRKMTREMVKL